MAVTAGQQGAYHQACGVSAHLLKVYRLRSTNHIIKIKKVHEVPIISSMESLQVHKVPIIRLVAFLLIFLRFIDSGLHQD